MQKCLPDGLQWWRRIFSAGWHCHIVQHCDCDAGAAGDVYDGRGCGPGLGIAGERVEATNTWKRVFEAFLGVENVSVYDGKAAAHLEDIGEAAGSH